MCCDSCNFARISLAVKHTSSSIKISDEQTLITNIVDENESSISILLRKRTECVCVNRTTYADHPTRLVHTAPNFSRSLRQDVFTQMPWHKACITNLCAPKRLKFIYILLHNTKCLVAHRIDSRYPSRTNVRLYSLNMDHCIRALPETRTRSSSCSYRLALR